MDENQYLPAAKLGVTKVNIDTDGRLVWCAIYRETFRDKPEDFDLRTPGKPFMAAYAEYITAKNKKLGSAGQLESLRKTLKKGCWRSLGFRVNTVQLVITTDSIKVFVNGGRCRCSGRFFNQFFIFRLMTRGLTRLRRDSIRSRAISSNNASYHA